MGEWPLDVFGNRRYVPAYGRYEPLITGPEARRGVKSGIEFYRKQKGLKQAEVATTLGTTEARMSRIELGQEIPTAAEVDKLVELLEVPPPYLFSRHLLNEIADRARAERVA